VSYPPPSNGVIPPSRGTNPYAEQAVSAAPGGTYNQYGAQQQNQNYGGNQYAQQAQGGNPYAQQQQYGQQEQYAMGGVGNGQQGGGDFWAELTNTNQNLTLLQEQIQAVGTAWCGGDCLFGIWVGTSGWWDYAIGGRGVRHLLRGRSVTISLVCHSDV